MSGLVGRAGELAALVAALDAAGPGVGSWVQVTGEPGIGKSRLVGELCRIADERGALVVVGRGAELEGDLPFGVVTDAFDDYLGSLDEGRLGELCGDHIGVIRRVFPALGGLERPVAQGSEDERYPTYRALRVLMERLAVPGPLVVVLDDLHWADTATIELVLFLLRRPLQVHMALVLVWRRGQAPRLADAVSFSAKDWPGTALELTGLTADEIGQMLGGAVDPAKLGALHRASGGNPFYAQALASSDAAAGAARPPGDEKVDDGRIPGSVIAAVRQEIDSLRAPARLLAQGAAVAGELFDPELAARCADLVDDEVLRGLDDLVAAEIVRPAQSPRRFAFRHPIVRRAIYDSAGPGWRLGAHARAAAALSEAGAPIVTLAHHVMRCGVAGDLSAGELLIDAAAQVASSAPASAAAWLEAASAIVPRQAGTAGLRLRLLAAQVRVYSFLGDLQAAHDALREALGLVPQGDPRRVQLVAGAAGIEHGLGRFVEARARLLAALGELPGARADIEAVMCVELAVSWLYTLDFAQASLWATRALKASRDLRLEGLARALLAFVHASAETGEGNRAARAHRTAAATILDGLGDDEVTARLDGLYYLGWAERLLEDYEAAAAHLGRAVAVAAAGGGSQWLVPTTIEQAKALACCGRIIEARIVAETAVEMARVSQVGLLVLLALTAQAGVLAAAGDIDSAIAAGAEALGLGSEGATYHAAIVRRHLALAYLEAGDAGRFGAELAKAEAQTDGQIVRDGLCCRILEAHSAAELALDRTDVAATLAEQAHELATVLCGPASTGFAHRARARVLARSHPEDALAVVGAAVAAFEEAGAAVEAARTKVLAGEVLAACGRTDEALAELAAAGGVLGGLGAQGAAEHAQRALRRVRRAGPRPPRAGRPTFGTGSLTRREHAVAELVADGRTNRQIAARLSISENTVESHLGRILAKLGVTGRAAVARAMNSADAPSGSVEGR